MMETGRKLGMPEKCILEKRRTYIGEILKAKKKIESNASRKFYSRKGLSKISPVERL